MSSVTLYQTERSAVHGAAIHVFEANPIRIRSELQKRRGWRKPKEKRLVLSMALITICTLCDGFPLSEGYPQSIEPLISLRQADEQGLYTFELYNRHSEDICFELGHGPRALSLRRQGELVPIDPSLPFASAGERCQVVPPAHTLSVTYNVNEFFPPLESFDQLCYSGKVWPRSQGESEYVRIFACIQIH